MPRINKVIELLEQGQIPFYHGVKELSYEEGVRMARTWADYVQVDMEHGPIDMLGLRAFMQGLVAGGPTPSGHRTPTVSVLLPTNGTSEHEVRANAWQIKQALAAGVQSILLCHAESPDAARAFVESARFPFHTLGVGEGLGVGRRGGGGQASAAAIWGLSVQEYMKKADVWPLNPEGEIWLGLNIEDQRCLANAEASTKVPGVAYVEWGPGDMGLSFGYPDAHDPPYPPEVEDARVRILAACKKSGVAFRSLLTAADFVDRVGEGVKLGMMMGKEGQNVADLVRNHYGRTMPW